MYKFKTSFDINKHISPEQFAILKGKIAALFPRSIEYNLVFVGSVGCGKSTLCTLLHMLLTSSDVNDVLCYPEFLQIESERSHAMLQKYLHKEISAYKFQRYILHCWKVLMKSQPLHIINAKRNRYNIYERCCDDSVICFANIMNSRTPQEMSDIELEHLFHVARSIDDRYNLPTYFCNKGVELYTIQSHDIYHMIFDIINVINSDLREGIHTRFVGIKCDLLELVHRIESRARPGESSYSFTNIRDFYNHYEMLYHHLKTRENRLKRFVDIGRLVEPYTTWHAQKVIYDDSLDENKFEIKDDDIIDHDELEFLSDESSNNDFNFFYIYGIDADGNECKHKIEFTYDSDTSNDNDNNK